MTAPPRNLDLKKDRGLTVEWADGSTSYYSVAYLRRMSPSAEARELREQLARNPLTVLPSTPARPGAATGALEAIDAELVGNYAIRIVFSDGHRTGLFSWAYLRQIDPQRARSASEGFPPRAPDAQDPTPPTTDPDKPAT